MYPFRAAASSTLFQYDKPSCRSIRPGHGCCSCEAMTRRASLFALLVSLTAATFAAAAELHGKVTFGDLPVPGATLSATKGEQKASAITDQQGTYSFPDLADGV